MNLAKASKVSTGHLQKNFKNMLGVSPKEAMDMMRLENFKENVRETDVTTSLYESGFGSSRSLYEKAGERLGMTPASVQERRKRNEDQLHDRGFAAREADGRGDGKRYLLGQFWRRRKELRNELRKEFFAAEITKDDAVLKKLSIRSCAG